MEQTISIISPDIGYDDISFNVRLDMNSESSIVNYGSNTFMVCVKDGHNNIALSDSMVSRIAKAKTVYDDMKYLVEYIVESGRYDLAILQDKKALSTLLANYTSAKKDKEENINIENIARGSIAVNKYYTRKQ